jgi:hypothetical protein
MPASKITEITAYIPDNVGNTFYTYPGSKPVIIRKYIKVTF